VPFAPDHPQVMAYARVLGGTTLAVIANVSGQEARFDVPDGLAVSGRCLVANVAPRAEVRGRITLAPWEAVAILAG
jgi:hypothetical protein